MVNRKSKSKKSIVKRKSKSKNPIVKRKVTTKPIEKVTPVIHTIETTIITTNSIEPWIRIKEICENCVKYYKFNKGNHNCDKFLISKTNDIIKIAKNNNIYEEIVYILRSKQSLINRLKDLIRLCNNKLSLMNL